MARARKDDAEGSRTVAVGGNSGARLKEHIEKIERLAVDKAEVQSDMKDIFTIAKGEGFDPKIMRIILRRRAMDRAERDEQDALVETYESAVGE